MRFVAVVSCGLMTLVAACTGPAGDDGAAGDDGNNGTSCTVEDNGDGTKTISCTDGTSVTVANGVSCTVADNGDGTKTISCTDGTSVIVTDGATAAEVFSLLAEMPETLVVTITNVTLAGTPVVDFSVRDSPALRGAVGLAAGSSGQLRFGVAKLVPAAAGAPNTWQSYINNNVTGVTSALGPPALTNALQATTERTGTLVSHGDGTYTYTFATNLSTVTNPITGLAIGFDPTLTHRVAIQMSGSVAGVPLPPANATYDLRPDGQPITVTRDIAQTSSCNECHGKLALHGGGRVDVEYCVTCHNPGTTDPETGNSVNMPYMVHAIHGADKRFEQGLPAYEVVGFGATVHDYAEVTYPQALNNCLKCHNGADTSTPDGNNWEEVQYRAACGGCHNVDTAGGGVVDHTALADAACADCHGPAGIEPVALVHASEDATPNTPQVLAGAYNFTYEINAVTMADATHPAIQFRIRKDGVALTDLSSAYLTGAPPAGLGLTSGPSFLLAWALSQDGITAPADFNNLGRPSGQALSVSLANIAAGTAGTLSAADVDGYFIATLTGTNQFPAGATLRTVALQGYWSQVNFFNPCPTPPASCNLARHTVSVEKTVTGDTDRRSVVDSAKCGNCHEWFLGHGGNRVYTTDVCVMCHVTNLSSSGRGADPATVQQRLDQTGSTTALINHGYDPADPFTFPEESMNFKDLIHGIHSSAKRADDGGSDFDFVRDRGTSGVFYYDMAEVTFPGVLNNCETCHRTGSYDVALPAGVLNSTRAVPGLAYAGTLPTPTSCDDSAVVETAFGNVLAARSANCLPNDTDIVTTPVAATCNGCHTSPLAELHMMEHGAYLRRTRAEVNANVDGLVETCVLCHGPGRLADVGIVHAP